MFELVIWGVILFFCLNVIGTIIAYCVGLIDRVDDSREDIIKCKWRKDNG